MKARNLDKLQTSNYMSQNMINLFPKVSIYRTGFRSYYEVSSQSKDKKHSRYRNTE